MTLNRNFDLYSVLPKGSDAMYISLRHAGSAGAGKNRNVPWISNADDGIAILKVWRHQLRNDGSSIYAVINARSWTANTPAADYKRRAVAISLERLSNRRIRVIVVEKAKDDWSHAGTRYDYQSLWLVEDSGQGSEFYLWRGRRSLTLGSANPANPKAYGNLTPERQEIVSNRIERDARVRGLSLERAESRCEIVGCVDASEYQSVDVHHITRLGDGGADHTDNTVVLCPACHSRVHRGITAVQKKMEQRLFLIKKARVSG